MRRLVAIWTYGMLGFGALHGWLHSVSDYAIPKFLQFILLLLSVPCFEISHFCFKRAYLINQARMRRICSDRVALGFHDSSLEFDDLGLEGPGVAQIYHRLCDIEGRLKARERGVPLGDANHNQPPFLMR